MRLRALGCYGGELLGYKSTAFLINEILLIDAGNINSLTGLDDLSRIRHVAISHSHLDHIKALPFLAEQLIGKGDGGLEVFGTEETVDALRHYIFNGSIWPDLSRLPATGSPAIRYKVMRDGETVYASGMKVKAISVNHTVPSVGFVIGDDTSSILYSGDTGPTGKLWEEANNTIDLKALMIEVSYPNRLRERAVVSRHMTPDLLVEELKKLNTGAGVMIFIYHLKPPFVDEIRNEICRLNIGNLVLLEEGDVFDI